MRECLQDRERFILISTCRVAAQPFARGEMTAFPVGKTLAISERRKRTESPRDSKTPSPGCVRLPFEV